MQYPDRGRLSMLIRSIALVWEVPTGGEMKRAQVNLKDLAKQACWDGVTVLPPSRSFFHHPARGSLIHPITGRPAFQPQPAFGSVPR